MKAIKLIPENFETITKEIPGLPVNDLKEMYDDRLALDETRSYIIQEFVNKYNNWTSPWVSVTSEYFDDEFEFDNQELDNQFTEITRK